jgi:hypothetical protein
MDYFNPIHALIEGTGALINSSKKRFSWRFELESEEHSVEFECSFLTNTRRVTFDGRLIYKGKKALGRDFDYKFQHKNHIITIINHRNDADLLVDNLSFDEIYSQKIWNRTFNKQTKIPDTEVIDPRPARYITEDEYRKTARIGDSLDEAPKISLHDLLYKEKNKNKNRLADDFLEFDYSQTQNDDLIEIQKKNQAGIDLLEIQDKSPKNDKNQIGIDNLIKSQEKNNKIHSKIEDLLEIGDKTLEYNHPNTKLDIFSDFSNSQKIPKDVDLLPSSKPKSENRLMVDPFSTNPSELFSNSSISSAFIPIAPK